MIPDFLRALRKSRGAIAQNIVGISFVMR